MELRWLILLLLLLKYCNPTLEQKVALTLICFGRNNFLELRWVLFLSFLIKYCNPTLDQKKRWHLCVVVGRLLLELSWVIFLRLLLKYCIPTLDLNEKFKLIFGMKTCVEIEVITIVTLVTEILYSNSRKKRSVETYVF